MDRFEEVKRIAVKAEEEMRRVYSDTDREVSIQIRIRQRSYQELKDMGRLDLCM